MKSFSFRRYFSLIAFLGIFASSAHAFTLNYDTNAKKTINAWNSSTVTYDYNYTSCPSSVSTATLEAAVKAALAVWNGVPSSSLTVAYGSSSTKTAAQAKSQTTGSNPLIVCDTSFSSTTGADGNYVPAAASVIEVDSDYHITFAVLYLNAETGKSDNIANIDSSLLSIIMAHEIGHSLGLGHSSSSNALMYYDASDKTTLNLAKDDVDGITYLYPRNELSGSTVMGCGSTKIVEKGNGPSRWVADGSSTGSSKRRDLTPLAREYGLLALVLFLIYAGFRGRRIIRS